MASVEEWLNTSNGIDELLQESSGFARLQLEAQSKNVKAGLKNAMAIAKLQSDTQRYGYDVQREVALKQLQENGRQFDLTHALDLKKFGVARAQAATDYLQTPDRFIQAGNFLNMSSRVMLNQGGASYNIEGTKPKSMADFAALEEGGAGGDRQVGADNVEQVAGGGVGADERVKVLKGLIAASPPSPDEGMDGNDFAVLNATRAILGMKLRPQAYAAIRGSKEGQQMLQSGAQRLGVNFDSWLAQQRKNMPGQGAARSYAA